jgi:hypothetical protein
MPFLRIVTDKDGDELWFIVVYGHAVEPNSSDWTVPRDRNFGKVAGRGAVGDVVGDGSLRVGRHCAIQFEMNICRRGFKGH